MVLGILSLVLCAPLGIAAWIMGNADLKEMDDNKKAAGKPAKGGK